MRDAYAHGDPDFDFPLPRKNRGRSQKPNALLRALKVVHRVLDYPNRIAGVVLVAVVMAICVNALVLQQSRHPAPLFRKSAALPVAPLQTPPPIAEKQQTALIPPAAPAAQPDGIDQLLSAPASAPDSASTPPAVTKEAGKTSHDPIAQLLKSSAQPAAEPSKTVLSAQRALVKLGFVLKPDGVDGTATRQAVEQFERDHGLAVHGELSPKILHELGARSGIAIE